MAKELFKKINNKRIKYLLLDSTNISKIKKIIKKLKIQN